MKSLVLGTLFLFSFNAFATLEERSFSAQNLDELILRNTSGDVSVFVSIEKAK